MSPSTVNPLVLYRFFSHDDSLLYVGMTTNPGNRFSAHSVTKPWWSSVSRIEIEHYQTINELKEAEREAIRREAPRHNVQHVQKDAGSSRPSEITITRCGLRVGEMYALGLDDGSCPVGYVTSLDEDGVSLELFSFLLGMTDGDVRWFRYSDIRRWARGYRLSKEQARERGYSPPLDNIWDMGPLETFQEIWLKRSQG
jgi:predicted GIY-YIG superfamily endonuclease